MNSSKSLTLALLARCPPRGIPALVDFLCKQMRLAEVLVVQVRLQVTAGEHRLLRRCVFNSDIGA